jgi:hypothetical protein
VFQGGDRLCSLKLCLFSPDEETHVSLQENHLCYEHEDLEHCFPVRTELAFERNTYHKSWFQGGEVLILLQMGPYRYVEKHKYLSNEFHVTSRDTYHIVAKLQLS